MLYSYMSIGAQDFGIKSRETVSHICDIYVFAIFICSKQESPGVFCFWVQTNQLVYYEVSWLKKKNQI